MGCQLSIVTIEEEEKAEAAFVRRCMDIADELVVVSVGDHPDVYTENPGVKHIVLPGGTTAAAALNEGLNTAGGLWVLLLDSRESITEEGLFRVQMLVNRMDREAYGIRVKHEPDDCSYRIPFETRLLRNRSHCRFEGNDIPVLPLDVEHKAEPIELTIIRKEENSAYAKVPFHQLEEQALRSRNPLLLLQLSSRLAMLGLVDRADRLWQRLLADDELPSRYNALLYGWRTRLLGRKDPTAALESIEEGLRLHPGYADLHYVQGSLLLRSGMHKEAADSFRRCLRPDRGEIRSVGEYGPLAAKALSAMARISDRQGEWKEAIDYYGKAYDADPTDVEALRSIAAISYRQSGEDGVIAALAASAVDRLEGAWHLCAEICRDIGLFALAKSYAETELERNPAREETAVLIGDCLIALGEPFKALPLYSRIGSVSTQFPVCLKRICMIGWLTGKPSQAEQAIAVMEAERLFPEAEVYQFVHRAVWGNEVAAPDAVWAYRDEAAGLCAELVKLALQAGQDEWVAGLIPSLERWESFQVTAGKLFCEHERYSAAERFLTRALDRDGADGDGELCVLLARSKRRQGKNGEAVRLLQSRIGRAAVPAEAYAVYADILAEWAGQIVQIGLKAHTDDPEYGELQEAWKRLKGVTEVGTGNQSQPVHDR